jgi:hypothetical protein
MLNKLKNGEAGSEIALVQFFLMLFFVVIDILPVTMKVSIQYGEYEAERDYIIYKAIEQRKADRKAIDLHILFYTNISVAKLNTKMKMDEVSDLLNQVNNLTNNLEEERKKHYETINRILEKVSVIKDHDIKDLYRHFFSHILQMFKFTVLKYQQKFLDYLRSL